MKEFYISANDAGQRLDKFLQKTAPELPLPLLYKAIRTKNVKINGKRAQISTRLCEGDCVKAFLPDEFFQQKETLYDFTRAGKELDIVYEDENLLLLNKKAGVLCHPDDREYIDTLIGRIQRYLFEKAEYLPEQENSFTPSLVNRIDRNTGGIVIAAKNAETLRILNQKMKDRELHKFYLCIVHGRLEQKRGTLLGYLIKDESKNKVTVSKNARQGAKEIRTKYKVLDCDGNLSLVEVELLTGRTHQIRAHFASIGHPLLGDGKYGTNAQNKKYGYKKQFLYSYKLVFDFTTDAGILNYLNHREFEIKDVWFKDAFYKGEL